MFGPFERRRGGANTNDLPPDMPVALFVTQACASALASFGMNELEAATQSLQLAADSARLITTPELRKVAAELVHATSEAMRAIDIGSVARADREGG